MYTASSTFHAAVASGNPQRILLIFPDLVFSNEDVDINTGVEVREHFNTEKDLCIGQVLSNEIAFAIFNDYGDLNSYEFGDFTATLGVQLTDTPYTETGNCSVVYGSDTYVGRNTSPYITKNGSAMANQPSFPVKSIIVYDGVVYAIGASGQCKRWVNGSGAVYTLNQFMVRKMTRKQGCGFSYNSTTRIMKERNGTREKIYEFVPLGVFTADRPNVPDLIRIDFTCNDQMMKLDKDMPDATALNITYPATVSTLFTKICQYFGVSYTTSTFINSTATISEEPEEFSYSTARTVLGWIAEAAGSNAVFNRDGQLELRWVSSAGASMDESGYAEFRPYWYETKTIDKVLNRDTQGSEEKSHGSGNTPYLIQDNPILRGCT